MANNTCYITNRTRKYRVSSLPEAVTAFHNFQDGLMKEGIAMNINKFTQIHYRLFRTVRRSPRTTAIRNWRRSHLLYALLTQDDSLILKLLEKMSIQGQPLYQQSGAGDR